MKQQEFLKALLAYLNSFMTCYYEVAPRATAYPYGVIPTINITPLDYGYLCAFDIELYINDTYEGSVEALSDSIVANVDRYVYNDKNIGFYVGFESLLNEKLSDMDITYRRISFIARIF